MRTDQRKILSYIESFPSVCQILSEWDIFLLDQKGRNDNSHGIAPIEGVCWKIHYTVIGAPTRRRERLPKVGARSPSHGERRDRPASPGIVHSLPRSIRQENQPFLHRQQVDSWKLRFSGDLTGLPRLASGRDDRHTELSGRGQVQNL